MGEKYIISESVLLQLIAIITSLIDELGKLEYEVLDLRDLHLKATNLANNILRHESGYNVTICDAENLNLCAHNVYTPNHNGDHITIVHTGDMKIFICGVNNSNIEIGNIGLKRPPDRSIAETSVEGESTSCNLAKVSEMVSSTLGNDPTKSMKKILDTRREFDPKRSTTKMLDNRRESCDPTRKLPDARHENESSRSTKICFSPRRERSSSSSSSSDCTMETKIDVSKERNCKKHRYRIDKNHNEDDQSLTETYSTDESTPSRLWSERGQTFFDDYDEEGYHSDDESGWDEEEDSDGPVLLDFHHPLDKNLAENWKLEEETNFTWDSSVVDYLVKRVTQFFGNQQEIT